MTAIEAARRNQFNGYWVCGYGAQSSSLGTRSDSPSKLKDSGFQIIIFELFVSYSVFWMRAEPRCDALGGWDISRKEEMARSLYDDECVIYVI
jgi:hypothetical protein